MIPTIWPTATSTATTVTTTTRSPFSHMTSDGKTIYMTMYNV